MICEYIELTLESLDHRDVAKAMLKFWLYQAEQARQHYSAGSAKVKHADRANEEAREEWKRSDDFGFGPHLPFPEAEINRMRSRLPSLKQNWEEAQAMAGYIINYITDKAHPAEKADEDHSH